MSEAWDVVKIVGTDEEATLIAGFLESREVPVEVESLLFHQEPVTFGHLGEVRIRVPAERADEARRLLAELDNAPGAALDTEDEPDAGPHSPPPGEAG